MKKILLLLFINFIVLNSICQEIVDTNSDLSLEETKIEETESNKIETYKFIVNRKVYKLNSIIKDEVPYFSIDSIFYPLTSIGFDITKDKFNYEITYEEKTINFSPIEGFCLIPADPELEEIPEGKELSETEVEERKLLEEQRQKEDLKLEVISILEEKSVFVTSDFLIKVLSKILKKQLAYDPNTGTFFIGEGNEIKINYGVKEENEYSVLKMLCPAQIKYKIKRKENLMTVSINSTFNIDKEDFLKLESKFFKIEDVYFQSSNTIIKILLFENVHKTYDTFDNNFSTLKLYFYSKDYYNPKPVVDTNLLINPKTETVQTVIIDPGHGGDDMGAVGKKGVAEKDITLAIAFKLSKILKSKGYNVIMTRYSDIFVPLKERTGIANNKNGDIFISIHVNASLRKAFGAETYYLSLNGMEQVSDTVAFENKEIVINNNNEVKEETKDDLSFILWDMAQTEYLKDSADLAEEVQLSMNKLTGIRDRGVKQASLVVLKGLNMPGILVEVAFISNPKEETQLTTDSFQLKAATAISESIDSYKLKYEERMKAKREQEISSKADIKNEGLEENVQ